MKENIARAVGMLKSPTYNILIIMCKLVAKFYFNQEWVDIENSYEYN